MGDIGMTSTAAERRARRHAEEQHREQYEARVEELKQLRVRVAQLEASLAETPVGGA